MNSTAKFLIAIFTMISLFYNCSKKEEKPVIKEKTKWEQEPDKTNETVETEKKEFEQLVKVKSELKKKYDKLCNSGKYMFEIQEQLLKDDFRQVSSSDFEKAPDGSTQVKTIYRKIYSEGKYKNLTVEFSLQPSYSLSSYYCNVQVW